MDPSCAQTVFNKKEYINNGRGKIDSITEKASYFANAHTDPTGRRFNNSGPDHHCWEIIYAIIHNTKE